MEHLVIKMGVVCMVHVLIHVKELAWATKWIQVIKMLLKCYLKQLCH